MSVSVIDETANSEDIINNAVKIIGRSAARLKFFEIVYKGKSPVKSQKQIAASSSFIEKRVLELGRPFIVGKVMTRKKIDKKIAFGKIDIYSLHKEQIIRRASKYQNLKINVKDTSKRKSTKKWDVFICHAYKDKKAVKPLAEKLREKGIEVWYDDFVVKLGDNLVDAINKGLEDSYFGLVVFSKNFLKKGWIKFELDRITVQSFSKKMSLLPLRYKISHEDLEKKYPSLSHIRNESLDNNYDELVKIIIEIVKKKRRYR